MTNLDTVLDRLVALAGDISGITAASKEYPAEIDNYLPFVFIYEGTAQYSQLNTDMWRITRDFVALLYVQSFNDLVTSEETAARAAARPFLVSYPSYFLPRNRLQRSDNGPAGMVSATISEDQGIQSASRGQKIYAGINFHHLVVYDEQLERV